MDTSAGNTLTPEEEEALEQNFIVWYYINGIVGTIIVVFGIPGNVTAAIVLLLPTMKNSTSILLVVMAVYDTAFLVLHALLQTIPLIFIMNNVCYGYLVVQDFLFKYFYAVVHFAHTGTIYMSVLVTLERAIIVLLPLRAKHICTRERAGIASLVVTMWSVVYNIPRCMEYAAELDPNKTYTRYTVKKSEFGEGHFFNVVYLIYLNSFFHFALPVGFIVILNAKMIQRVCSRGRQLVCLGPESLPRADSQTRLTVMIITLTVIFCLCQLLAALELILYPFEPSESGHVNVDCLLTCTVISSVAQTSTLLNSATNFVVYSTFGRKFRRSLKSLCCSCCCFWASRRGSSISSRSPRRTSTSMTMTHFSAKCGSPTGQIRQANNGSTDKRLWEGLKLDNDTDKQE